MDRRLTGVLAWGALILILGIPGAEMIGRRAQPAADAALAGAATDPDASMLSSNAAAQGQDGDVLGPPVPSEEAVAEKAPADIEDVTEAGIVPVDPGVTSLASAAFATVQDDRPVEDAQAPAAVPDTAVPVVADVQVETAAPPTPEGAATPSGPAPAATSDVAALDPSEIAARVGEIILSGESTDTSETVQTATAPADAASTVPDAVLSGDAWWDVLPPETAAIEPPLPALVPYPAPASQRPHAPVVVAAARPTEPPVEIRPDNAVFFRNWSLVPPMSIGTGPGR